MTGERLAGSRYVLPNSESVQPAIKLHATESHVRYATLPEYLVETDWLEQHLNDANLRIIDHWDDESNSARICPDRHLCQCRLSGFGPDGGE